MIRIQQRLDNIKELRGQVQITDFADQLVLPFCGSDEEVQAAIGFSPSAIKGLGADIGTCGFVGPFTTEDDKINVNCANGDDATAATLKSALDALIFFPAYDPVFEEQRRRGLAPRSRDAGRRDPRLHRREHDAHARPRHDRGLRLREPQGSATTRRTTTSTRSAS